MVKTCSLFSQLNVRHFKRIFLRLLPKKECQLTCFYVTAHLQISSVQFNVLCTSVHFVLPNQIFRFDNCSKLTLRLIKSYSFEPMGKSLGFEEDVVERGGQRDEEAKICRGRV